MAGFGHRQFDRERRPVLSFPLDLAAHANDCGVAGLEKAPDEVVVLQNFRRAARTLTLRPMSSSRE